MLNSKENQSYQFQINQDPPVGDFYHDGKQHGKRADTIGKCISRPGEKSMHGHKSDFYHSYGKSQS